MTMEGFSVDQCVAEILCGETMELEGVEMSYNCFDGGSTGNAAIKLIATMTALAATVYAMWIDWIILGKLDSSHINYSNNLKYH